MVEGDRKKGWLALLSFLYFRMDTVCVVGIDNDGSGRLCARHEMHTASTKSSDAVKFFITRSPAEAQESSTYSRFYSSHEKRS